MKHSYGKWRLFIDDLWPSISSKGYPFPPRSRRGRDLRRSLYWHVLSIAFHVIAWSNFGGTDPEAGLKMVAGGFPLVNVWSLRTGKSPFWRVKSRKKKGAIFNSYVSLPEGKWCVNKGRKPSGGVWSDLGWQQSSDWWSFGQETADDLWLWLLFRGSSLKKSSFRDPLKPH